MGRLRHLRPRFVGLAVIVVLLVGAVFAVRLSGDGLGDVRGSEHVEAAVINESGSVEIDLRRGVDQRSVVALLADLPDDARRVTLRLGPAELSFRRAGGSRREEEQVSIFVAAAGVRAPVKRIDVRASGVRATVERREQAAPLAIDLAERLNDTDGRVRGRYLAVDEVRSGSVGGSVVGIALGGDLSAALAVVRASQLVASRAPRVSVSVRTATLRVTANSAGDVGAAWEVAAQALQRAGATAASTTIYVDLRADPNQPTRPELSGKADQSPDRALRLLRTLSTDAARVYAAADLGYAEAQVDGEAAARKAATLAQAAGVGRFAVSWKALSIGAAWMSGTAGTDRAVSKLDDEPAVVLELLDGVARARRAGIPALQWDRRAASAPPQLRLARPDWLRDGQYLPNDPETLRRTARAVRAIGWTGTARFELILGPGSCPASPRTASVVRIESTRDGRATEVERGAGRCTTDDAVSAARSAWDATATK